MGKNDSIEIVNSNNTDKEKQEKKKEFKKSLFNTATSKSNWLMIGSFVVGIFFPPVLLLGIAMLIYKTTTGLFHYFKYKMHKSKEIDFSVNDLDLTKSEFKNLADNQEYVQSFMKKRATNFNRDLLQIDFLNNNENGVFSTLEFDRDTNTIKKYEYTGKKDQEWLYSEKELSSTDINWLKNNKLNFLQKHQEKITASIIEEIKEKEFMKSTNDYESVHTSNVIEQIKNENNWLMDLRNKYENNELDIELVHSKESSGQEYVKNKSAAQSA